MFKLGFKTAHVHALAGTVLSDTVPMTRFFICRLLCGVLCLAASLSNFAKIRRTLTERHGRVCTLRTLSPSSMSLSSLDIMSVVKMFFHFSISDGLWNFNFRNAAVLSESFCRQKLYTINIIYKNSNYRNTIVSMNNIYMDSTPHTNIYCQLYSNVAKNSCGVLINPLPIFNSFVDDVIITQHTTIIFIHEVVFQHNTLQKDEPKVPAQISSIVPFLTECSISHTNTKKMPTVKLKLVNTQ